MNGERCAQTALIEALHDGRLGPSEAASLARHVQTCASCARWQAELVTMRAAIRAPLPAPTPLEHQRARVGLLRAAAGGAPTRARPSIFWTLVGGLAFAATAAAGVAGWQALRAPAPEAPRPERKAARAQPGPTTAMRGRRQPGPATRAAPAVDDAPIIDAPIIDAPPIEPSVAEPATAEPTTAVPRAPAAETSDVRVRPSWSKRPPVSPATTAAPRSRPGPRRRAQPLPVTSAPTPPAPAASPASEAFAAAMKALADADFGLAARRFAAFCEQYPTDPRTDEAAYLIAIAHERAGRLDDARAAARKYLQERPDGAHRARAARIRAIPAGAVAP